MGLRYTLPLPVERGRHVRCEHHAKSQRPVKDNGERVGVVLSWKDYQELCAAQSDDPELLVGLNDAELERLTGSMLALRLQERLSHLLHLSQEGNPNIEEQQELDRLLEQVDQMNVLKARAIYTLRQRQETTAA